MTKTVVAVAKKIFSMANAMVSTTETMVSVTQKIFSDTEIIVPVMMKIFPATKNMFSVPSTNRFRGQTYLCPLNKAPPPVFSAMITDMLETPRLRLMSWQPEDWLQFRPIATDPEVMKYITGGIALGRRYHPALCFAPDFSV